MGKKQKILVLVEAKNGAKRTALLIKKLQKPNDVKVVCFTSRAADMLGKQGIKFKMHSEYIHLEDYKTVFGDMVKICSSWYNTASCAQALEYKSLEGQAINAGDVSETILGYYTVLPMLRFFILAESIIKKEAPDRIFAVNFDFPSQELRTQQTVPKLQLLRAIAESMHIPLTAKRFGFAGEPRHFLGRHALTRIYRKNFHYLGWLGNLLGVSESAIKNKGRNKAAITENDKGAVLFVSHIRLAKYLESVIAGLVKEGKKVILLKDQASDKSQESFLKAIGVKCLDFEDFLDSGSFKNAKAFSGMAGKKWKTLKHDKELNSSFSYHGASLWWAMKPHIQYMLCAQSLRSALFAEAVSNAINEINPSVIILTAPERPVQKAAALIAAKKSYPTLHAQSASPMWPGEMFRIVADKTALWGNFDKKRLEDNGISASSATITGTPRFDSILRKKFDRKWLLKKYGLDGRKKIVLLTSQTPGFSEEDNKAMLNAVFAGISPLKEKTDFVVKLHPVETDTRLHRAMAQEHSIKPIIFTSSEADLYELISVCDVLVSSTSTTTIEAMMMGKPVITVNLDLRSTIEGAHYRNSGAVFPVNKPAEFAPAIKKMLFEKGFSEKLKKRMKEFVEEIAYRQDGKATERVVGLINEISRKS